MAKRTSGKQIEMLLPIRGSHSIKSPSEKGPAKTVSYEKIVESLRKKGLTKSVVKK
jgi:hypothetical protein